MSKLFRRVCEININGRVLSYPPFAIEFEKTFSEAGPAQTTAKVSNPSPETYAAAQKRGNSFPKVIISAGYESDYGTCVVGEIIKQEMKIGLDRVLTLNISDKTSLWTNARINKSWSGMISAREVARQIFNEVGITSSEIVFKTEKVYERGAAFAGVPFSAAMERIARDTGSKFFFRNGRAVFLPEGRSTGTAHVLNYQSGLIEAVKIAGGYKVKSLFLYAIDTGSLVSLDKNNEVINLRVKKGKLKFASSGSAYAEFEAKTL